MFHAKYLVAQQARVEGNTHDYNRYNSQKNTV